jgi:hypothetical protein
MKRSASYLIAADRRATLHATSGRRHHQKSSPRYLQLFPPPEPSLLRIKPTQISNDPNSELGCPGRLLQAKRRRIQPSLKDRFVSRSALSPIDTTTKLTAQCLQSAAWNTEALHTPTKPYVLLNFEDASEVEGCKTMADRVVGGFSTASLDFEPAEPASNTPAHARFHGSISTKLPANWRVERTGMSSAVHVEGNGVLIYSGVMNRIRRIPQQRSRLLALRSSFLGR